MDKKTDETSEKLFDLKKIGAIIKKNYLVIARDKARLLPALLFPIVIMLVLGFATGSSPKHIPATIVVHDNSPLSQSIIQAISGSEFFSVSRLVSTEGEARQLLDEGKVKVIIEIPPDLQENIQNNIQESIIVIVDESDSSIAATSRAVLKGIISGISLQLSQEEIRMFSQANPQQILNPIVYEEKPAYGTGRQALDFVIPALIAMTIFQGAVMGMSRSVAGEKHDGSLTRVFLTPTSNVTIITGTLLFYIIFEMIRASFLILVSIVLFNVKISGSYLLIGFILFIYVSVCSSIGMLISAVVKTESQFQGIALLISLPTLFLSGVFFPVQAMPKVMQGIAAVLPVTYAAESLRNVIAKGLGIGFSVVPISILLIFLIAMLAGTVIFFKRNIE